MRFTLILILFVFLTGQVDAQEEKSLFAKITDEGYEYVVDTTKVKLRLVEILHPKNDSIGYDKIEIRQDNTLTNDEGVFAGSYYYFLATDFDRNLRTARWLKKEDNKLYILNKPTSMAMSGIEVGYVTCPAENTCFPHMGTVEGDWFWVCADKVSATCLKNSSGCKRITGVSLEKLTDF